MSSSLDNLFKDIERGVVPVLFLTDDYPTPSFLKNMLKEIKTVFLLDAESSEILQIAQVPQIRIYVNGSERKSLIGDEILRWKEHVNKLGATHEL